jgi:hypothetical protein
MATLSASHNAGTVTVTGSGYSANARVVVNVQYVATNNARRFNEMRQVVADGSGNVTLTYPVPFPTGTITARSLTGALQNVLEATTAGVSV